MHRPEPILVSRTVDAIPAWAVQTRYLMDQMISAGEAFSRRYTRPDGTLIWREQWPGMDGSDDGYESFLNFALFSALAGPGPLHQLARHHWNAITWQFTQYGQIYREFDAYYDWMHHGESYAYLYYLALADPSVYQDRTRAVRFAAMYTGEDPEAPNWDPDRRMIRSPINGSRGPRFTMTAEDWVTHRPVLAHYLVPYEDIPGLEADDPFFQADWNDDQVFAAILDAMNARMVPGDVPLNLTATSLVTHAYLYTGEEKYRRWVLDYVEAWAERARKNHGILPDNVGPNGRIGERMGGKWWGGYYGWRWPHGAMNLLESTLIAGTNAALLTGEMGYLDLFRSQWDLLWSLGRSENGVFVVPHRHGDRGWFDFRPPNPALLIHLYAFTDAPEDRQRLEALGSRDDWTERARFGKGAQFSPTAWFALSYDGQDAARSRMLDATAAEMSRRLARIEQDHGDPASWDVHHWQDRNPVVPAALVQLALGTPGAVYHGGLLHARVRYFDPEARRAGLPDGVAACVERIEDGQIRLALVNTNLLHRRRVGLQAGAFAEHRFVDLDGRPLDADYLELLVEPGAAASLSLGLKLHVGRPTYTLPWERT